jgi:hypothetical protein
MQHYTTYASQIIMSIPDLDPISSSHLELALSQPVGADLVVDALRTSLLGVAAMHQAFLLTRAGAVPNGEEQRQLANFFRRDAKKKLANACLQSNELVTRSDAALMAVQAIAMIDIFAGVSGGHWSRNLGLGKALVMFCPCGRHILFIGGFDCRSSSEEALRRSFVRPRCLRDHRYGCSSNFSPCMTFSVSFRLYSNNRRWVS